MESSAKNTVNIEESFMSLSRTIIQKMNKSLDDDNLVNLNHGDKKRKNIKSGCCNWSNIIVLIILFIDKEDLLNN